MTEVNQFMAALAETNERVEALELHVTSVDPSRPGHALRLDRLETLILRQTAQVGWLIKGGGLLAVYKVLEFAIDYAQRKP